MRGGRPLHGQAARRRRRPRPGRGPLRRQSRPAHTVGGAADGERRGWRDVAHSHTWYTGLAGHLAGALYDIPHVVTAHSLEPRRPWKAEQLGGRIPDLVVVRTQRDGTCRRDHRGQRRMRADVLDTYPAIDPARVHVVHNGIDTDVWYPGPQTPAPPRYSPRTASRSSGRSRSFVGRITRQKGLAHLVAAAHRFDPSIQLVLCAGAPDTADWRRRRSKRSPASPRREAECSLDPRHATPPPRCAKYFRRDGFRVPVGLRAAGDRELEAMACATAWSPRTSAASRRWCRTVSPTPRALQLVRGGGLRTRSADAVNAVAADAGAAAQMGRGGTRPCNGRVLVGPGGAADAGGLPGRTRSPIARDPTDAVTGNGSGKSGDRLGAPLGGNGEGGPHSDEVVDVAMRQRHGDLDGRAVDPLETSRQRLAEALDLAVVDAHHAEQVYQFRAGGGRWG
ncbi:glycosyltransferase [Rhodococcus hoagii]|nr:glycosyltransferase [Prescottella equi]